MSGTQPSPRAYATGLPARRPWPPFSALRPVGAALAAARPLVDNLGQQLRPEQLEGARRLWAEVGPADYDLEVAVGFGRDPRPERYTVLVRGRRVVFAAGEGEV